MVVVALLSGAEAGCAKNGCCFCNKDEGYVINMGLYKTDCDAGCEYKEGMIQFTEK